MNIASRLSRPLLLAALVAVFPAVAVGPVSAQADSRVDAQVISANPFGLLLEFFNVEYEREVTPSSTAGIGGSTYSADDERYLNADVFWRYYPNGTPLDGWAFGAKVGFTSVDDGSYLGYGFDVNRSWLLGSEGNFYVGVGFGLKRLLGVDEDDIAVAYVPTLRIVNVGFAF